MRSNKSNNRYFILLGIIELFVAIGAIPAGISLLIDSTGNGLGMTLDVLQGTPFKDYLIPGIFLLTFNGIFHLGGAILSFRKYNISGLVGLALGVYLALWISAQVYFLGLTFFLQYLFFFIGIAEILLGYLLVKSISR